MVNEKIDIFRRTALKIYRDFEEKRKAKTTILVHLGHCSSAVGAQEVYQLFKDMVKQMNMQDEVSFEVAGCPGMCNKEPLVQIIKPGFSKVIYCLVDHEKAEAIFIQHVCRGIVIQPWLLSNNIERR